VSGSLKGVIRCHRTESSNRLEHFPNIWWPKTQRDPVRGGPGAGGRGHTTSNTLLNLIVSMVVKDIDVGDVVITILHYVASACSA
jgi:hypothetical protein